MRFWNPDYVYSPMNFIISTDMTQMALRWNEHYKLLFSSDVGKSIRAWDFTKQEVRTLFIIMSTFPRQPRIPHACIFYYEQDKFQDQYSAKQVSQFNGEHTHPLTPITT